MTEISKERKSVAGIAIEDGKVFIARRKSGGDLGGKWEFPGGKVRPGESGEDALKREYAEELSIPVKIDGRVGDAEFIHKEIHFTLSAYRVDLLSKNFSFLEHTEYRWVKPEELEALDFADSDRKLFPAVREAAKD
jgi:8-oxo-dGTP diphosphatase